MARLIPRKQIEEQQDLSGSLKIGGDLIVTGSSLFSGSLQVDNDFFLGNELTDRGEITGSLFLSGSFIIDGELNLANLTQLSATASNALLAVDTTLYDGIRSRDFGANLPTLYVSSTDGDDSNDGRSIQYPLRTIKKAASLATPGYDGRYGFDTGSVFNGYVLKVQAGTYLEDNPVILPKNTSIWGAGLRITKINAKNPEQDLFYVNSGCYIAEVTMGGLRLWPDQINPERGFAVAFQPGAFITTSPYIQNCSQISNQENSFTELYEDIPPGGGGLYVNGDAVDPDSPLCSMVLDAYTQISPNGVGCLVNGRGFIQLVSFFNNFSYYSIRVNNGGHATLNNSNISFGLFGMYASGSRFISGSGGNIAARDSVRGTWSCVVDVLNKGLENGLPTITKLNTAEGIRLTSPALYTQSRVSATTTLSTTAADEIFSDYKLISEILDKGVSNFPTLLAKSSIKGYGFDSPYNILGAQQITSSISATQHDLNTISASYAAILSILANGTGSFNFKSNTSASRQIGNDGIEQIANIATNYTSSVSSSFGTIINILKSNKKIVTSGTTEEITNYFGETSYLTSVNTVSLSTAPPYVANTSGSIKGGTTEQIMLGVTSSLATINSVSASFSIVYNILANGTGSNILSIPANHQKEYTIVNNNSSSYQWLGVTSTVTPNVLNVTNNGSGNYVINGQSNPTLSLIEGQTYTFNINASGHPFWIKTNISLGTQNAYNTGVTNNGIDNGTIIFVVPVGAPTLYYNCQFHSSMAGTINTITTSVSNNNITSSYNPTIKLFRGETYKFNVDAVEDFGGIEYPFWIRTQQLEGITERYDYNIGVVNNGDSRGTITFTVPYNAPNKLYYVSQNKSSMGGIFDIVNSSTTPFDLIKNTLTYPATIQSGSIAKTNIDIVTAYEILVNNREFIKDEVTQFVSSSWSGFAYTQSRYEENVEYIVDGVAKDLLFGGNEESIRNGLFYYQYPFEVTPTQLGPTLTAVKYAAGVSLNLIRGKVYIEPTNEADDVWDTIRDNKTFIQNEVITYLSSSWSNFYYNEAKCRRDTGYILDAVATDAKYGGNERSIIAGEYYYQFPSLAIIEGDGDGVGQLGQTSDGIRYASGVVDNLLKQKTFTTPPATTLAAYNNLINNKEIIQNETIQFINTSFPNLKYIQATCKRDVGYIVDNIATDLLYGGIERGVTAGRYYYDYPSLATTTQRTPTIAGIRYAKIIGDTIVQNQILDTPRIVFNDEKNFRLSSLTNQSSSFSGSIANQNSISSSFTIIESIVKRGISVIPSIVAQNNGQNWSNVNPLNITNGVQITSTTSSANLTSSIDTKFDIITSIIQSGSLVKPAVTSSQTHLIIVSGLTPITSPSASQSEANAISSSIATIVNIVQNGTGSLPTFQSNTLQNIKVTNINQWTGSNATGIEATAISSSIVTITNIITNGLGVVPTITLNTSQSIKVTNTPQYISSSFSGSSVEATLISASISLVVDILSGNGGVTSSLLLPTSSYVSASNNIVVYRAYNLLKQNIPFIQAETIAYLSSSWNGFEYNDISCSRDIGLIVSGAAEDLLFGSYSASLVNGKYYLEYPSDATGSQLNQTVDGIKYASKLAQKTLQNIIYTFAPTEVQNASLQLKNNREFIQNETITYLSSSWGNFPFTASKCGRDIGHVIDAVRTDLVYGGNERSVNAGVFYYLYPSQATGSQLIPTIDGINYASRITQKIVVGTTFITASQNKRNASNLLSLNKNLIAKEVVEYVSSSWFGVSYNQAKCERDVKYIIDAVRTDLVYGGNERTITAGTFYYLYPSAATVGGVPSVTNQLDPTITGINYGSGLAQKIIIGSTFVTASNQKLNVRNLIQSNRAFIQAETIQYTNAFYPDLIYNQASCSRDVGFIIDSVSTDILYGGNERSVESGVYYYKFPSKATSVGQKGQTIDSIDYANSLVNKIVSNIVLDSVNFSKNTDGNIKVTNTTQYTSSLGATIIQVNEISSSFGLVTGIINDGVKSFTPTTATYNPANGEFVITIPSHTLTKYNSIYIRPESFVFTCEMDGNRTEHKLPGVGQYPYSNKLQIQSVTTNTITVNVGASGPNVEFTPTAATYNPANGEFVLTVGSHSLSVGEGIVFATRSLAFTCDMDNNQSTKSYPRFGIDPYAVRSIPITGVTATTLTVNAGISGPNKFFTPTSASYNALTGDMVVNVGQHGLGVGRGIVLASASIAFTCDQDNNQTTHSYPRSGSDPYAGKSIEISSVGFTQHTVTNAPHNAATGLVTLTIAGHGFSNGDYVKISDNSLTYTCELDENVISKSYPRAGYDYPSGRWLEITNVTTNTFEINVGPSSYTGQHTFVTASINGVQRQDGTFTINVGDGGSASGSIHTFVSASVNAVRHLPQSIHTFLSASAGAIKHLPQAAHTFVRTTKNSISTLPVLVENGNGLIKVSNTTQFSSSISASGAELDIITSSFKHVGNIIENGITFVPDSLARNYNYGFELATPTLLHISSKEQTIGTGSYNLSSQITNVSSSYGIVVNVVKNGLSVLPTLVTNTSSSLKVTNANPIRQAISASSFDTNKIASGFDLILNVIENGISVLPTIVTNTSASIKVTNTPQLISGSAAGRLQGKLISSSLSLVIDVLLNNGTSSIGFRPSTFPIVNTNTKINSAYNLLVSNSKFIVDETIAYMSSSWSGFEYTQSKCERDLTGILSGSAFDLLYGGNSASLFNGKFYFDFPSQATGSQLDQTITAIKYASGLAEKVVLNTVFTHISASINQPTSASWNSLRTNKGFIQSESIAYLSSSWSNFEYNETTCKRDIGYIIDAVATDLLYGGNERSVVAGRYYYDYPSQATNAQLEPTLTGVRYAKGTSMNVVVNKQIFTASLEVQYAYDLIKANKLFIQSESVAFVNVKYPDLDYSESKCYRDLGYIIDGVATDLLYGGNERSRDNADYYYQFPSQANGFGSQVVQTTDAIKYAARFTTASISSTLIAAPLVIPNTQANIKVTNATQLVTSSLFGTVAESTKVSASISIVTNIIANGTASLPTLIPYTTQSVDTNVIYSYNLLKANIGFIVSESIAYLSSSWSTASYDESKCGRDLRGILSGSAEDLLYNANSASLFNGIFYYQFPSQAQGAQLNQTLDGINYASILAQNIVQNVTYVTASVNVSASYALIRNNREFIQNETIAYLSSSWSTASYVESTCKRDVGHIIDAVSTDLLYGGNQRSTYAGIFYYLYPSQANGTGSQVQPTLTGVNYAGQLSKNVAASLTFVTASQLVSASVNLLRKNREFIQDETLAYLTASWSTFEYDKVKCKRDTGFIIDGVITDLLYGGNERGVLNGKFYYEYPSLAIVEGDGDGLGQLGQTIDGINYAGRIAQKIVKNIVFQTASLQASASFDLLRKNKPFIAAETIAYVSSSWSGVYYNEATCKRDVGYLIDAAATDVLYGGNERSVIAGQYYYLYPSNATNKGVPSTQNQSDPTITGIRYAGKLSKKVIINPTYLVPSASLLTTAKLLTDNKQLIQKETITFLSSSWSGLKYNEVSCSRDLGFIIDAIRTDLVYGGNERSIEAGSYYYKFPSVTNEESYGDNKGQKKQTVDGINFARGLSEKIVANTLLTYLAPSTLRRQAAERLKGGKDELKQRAIGYTNGAFPYLVYNEASCSRDTGFIVDACVTDLLYGGNERGIEAASSYYDGQYGSAIVVTRDQLLETLETNRYLRTKAEFIAAGAPLEVFGSLIVATGIDYSYNGSGVTFKALPPNQGGSGVPNPIFEITELGGGRIFFTSGNQDGDFRIGTGLSINQATGTLVGRTFSKSLFSLVTPFSLALQI